MYLAKKSVNKADVARKTGLSPFRLSQLSINPKSKLRADEVYLIALAIQADPTEVFMEVCKDLALPRVK